MDRFMFKIVVHYPNKGEELEIMNRMATDDVPGVTSVISKENLLRAREMTDKIYVDENVKTYIVDLVMATRNPSDYGLGQLQNLIQVGASPRATISLMRASKAHAFMRGRGYVTAEDVKAIAYNVLRHRLILTFEAEAEEVVSDMVIKDMLNEIEVP
jgi:MoxR-like ATPase